VFDLYRSGEFAEVACETESRDGLFIAAEGYIVEVLVDGRPARVGEQGELFITDLNNRCMPFIRYATGDRGVALGPDTAEPHPRGLPRIGQLASRAGAVFSGVGGLRVPSGFFSALFAEYGYAVRRFRVSERASSGLLLHIEKAPRYSESTLETIKARIRERLGTGLEIDVVFDEPAKVAPSQHAAPASLAAARNG
jgi:phenylacetate-CoA ligase